MLFHCNCRLCVIAGNISPIDVITHVPVLCEEAEIPYVYVSSKEVSFGLKQEVQNTSLHVQQLINQT